MSKKKILTLVLALALIATCAIGGTVAWLIDTKTADNTFTMGNIGIKLEGGTIVTEGSKFVPGEKIPASTKVTVEANSEKCYLFIQITDSNNDLDTPNKIIQYTLKNEGWTQVTNTTDWYYRVVKTDSADQSFDVFDSNLTVNEDLTKEKVDNMSSSAYPVITIKAAAVQYANISTKTNEGERAADAFAKVPNTFTGNN